MEVVESVVVTLRPTRTRKYSRTLLDLVNDMFVPCTGLEAVTCTEEAQDAVGQRLVQELADDAPSRSQDGIAFKWDRRVWGEHLETLWNDAIHTFKLPLIRGKYVQDQRPEVVYVALKPVPYRAWGGQVHTTYRPVEVWSYPNHVARGDRESRYVIEERPLLGVEAFAEAS